MGEIWKKRRRIAMRLNRIKSIRISDCGSLPCLQIPFLLVYFKTVKMEYTVFYFQFSYFIYLEINFNVFGVLLFTIFSHDLFTRAVFSPTNFTNFLAFGDSQAHFRILRKCGSYTNHKYRIQSTNK